MRNSHNYQIFNSIYFIYKDTFINFKLLILSVISIKGMSILDALFSIKYIRNKIKKLLY